MLKAVQDRTAPIPIDEVRVRFLDLSVTNAAERADIIGAVNTVLDHGRVVLGPEVAQFEQQVAAYCRRKHCIGVNTGTDALILALKALDIGPGDEVITTPLSWLATASAILMNGGTPVFGDIDETLNLDPATIEPLIGPKTKAILAVHFTGRLARMPELRAIADKHKLLLIEDGAQAFGATYNGIPCGGFGDIACISLNPMKVLGGLGDAGVILTDDASVAKRLDLLRHSGVVDRDYCYELSHNCRLDTVQAAVLIKRLARFDTLIAKRRAIAARYNKELGDVVAVPPAIAGYEDVFYTYQVRTPQREDLRRHLAALGIETRIQHPIIMNDQPAFQGKFRGTSPRASRLVHDILCIPAHEKLTTADQDFVIASVHSFFGR